MLASYAAGPTDEPLLEETIGANLRRTAARFGEREALVVRHEDYRATYAELDPQVDRAARAFRDRGRPRYRVRRAPREVQDPALLEVRRRVPDDGQREVRKFRMREIAAAELGLASAAATPAPAAAA